MLGVIHYTAYEGELKSSYNVISAVDFFFLSQWFPASCDTNVSVVWASRGFMFKNKPYLVKFRQCILVS